ncbi:flagellar hook-associated protein FlgK [Thioalkalivibrio sulfidiphilus]|uniref:flagellar hook-associated protein FlgK n=1 Tax=Thioalkalivibrio sulfidiphilus TaxID=1033854 RepID=UPI0004765E42|nr:flagellar hook-associated protein FlgK [Thioalkalivibrio sulfidiphilus]
MSSGVLGIGVSGLLAFQRALGVTGNNIANSATEGYSRQRIDLSTQIPQFAGNGYFGSGVQVSGVHRIFDQFVETQLRNSTSASEQYALYYDFARRVDNLLADPDSGLAPGLQQFFAAVQDVANDPTSNAARQVLISEAESLVDRFSFLNQRLEEQRNLVNGQIQTTVAEINSLAEAIADLNKDIVAALGRGGGAPPNDLLDQRDRLVLQLSELVSVNTIEQDDGALNVFIGNGQNLVLGNRATVLVADGLGPDPTQMQVGYVSPGATVDITPYMTGGRLGALLDLRTSVLDVAQNSMGRTAVGLAQAFNDQHRLGMDLNGALGEEFFRVPVPQVIPGAANTASGAPTVSIEDYTRLTVNDYRLRFDGSLWQLRREPGGQLLGTVDPTDPPEDQVIEVDGLRLDISTITLPADPLDASGDTYLIRPTRNGAQQIDTLITDTRRVAAATPEMLAAAGGGNTGEASVLSVGITDASGLTDLSPVTVTVIDNAGTLEFVIDGDVVATFDLLNPTTEINYNGWQLVIEGEPAVGDNFQVSFTTAAVGDNRNALALAGLQDQRLMADGTATLEATYNTLVAEVGTRTRQAEIAARAQVKLLDEARAQRESISGVNLDEEAANLLRYQQAYQAAAQVISVTNSLFDTLINAVRR